MKKLIIMCAVMAVMAIPSVVHAAFFIHSDIASWNAAAGSPLLTQDLQTYLHGDNLNGVELLPGLNVTSNASTVKAWALGGGPDIVLGAFDIAIRQAGNLYYDINLSDLYTAVSFDIDGWDPASGPGTMDILFADNSSAPPLLLTQGGSNEQSPVFFGITSDIPITTIRWYEGLETGSGFNEETALDNFAVVPVPVPGAVLLGMLGLSVAGIKLRKSA